MVSKQIDISKLKPNPNNPRIIKDDKFKKLVQSIKEFPEMLELRPIVVNDKMMVLGGNMRLKACQEAGLKKVPCVVTTIDKKKQNEFIIKDNLGYGEWDWETLANEWDQEELEEWGLDVKAWHSDSKDDDYEIPDEIKTELVIGDLIEIGSHRLVCGDCKNAETVKYLMNGKYADMVFTDPPFDLCDYSWTDIMLAETNGHLFILNSEQRNVDISTKHRELLKRWYAVDFRKAHNISNNVPMSRVDFIVELRNSDNVKFINRNKGFRTLIESTKNHSDNEHHKQEKNPELPATFIEHHTKENEIVLDLFLGSGTTMVAAEQLGRICYGMEIDPKYCQVVIDRMKKLVPDIQIKVNGKAKK